MHLNIVLHNIVLAVKRGRRNSLPTKGAIRRIDPHPWPIHIVFNPTECIYFSQDINTSHIVRVHHLTLHKVLFSINSKTGECPNANPLSNSEHFLLPKITNFRVLLKMCYLWRIILWGSFHEWSKLPVKGHRCCRDHCRGGSILKKQCATSYSKSQPTPNHIVHIKPGRIFFIRLKNLLRNCSLGLL